MDRLEKIRKTKTGGQLNKTKRIVTKSNAKGKLLFQDYAEDNFIR